MLKHCLLALMLAGLVFAVGPSAIAQDAGTNNQQGAPPSAPPEHGGRHWRMDPAKRAAMLGKQLNLSSDQQSKVQDILTSEQSQTESLRSDSSVSPEDRHSKMMDIHKASNDQIRALLDPDQQKKWDEMQSRREQWMQGHHEGGQPPATQPNSPPPPQ